MRFLSTQNQGAAAYVTIPNWTRPSTPGWTVAVTCRIFSIATEQIILGNSGNNTSMFSVMPDGSLRYRDSGVNQIVSAAGVITPNQFYTFLFRRVGSVLELWLGPDGMRDDLIGGTKIGETASLTQALFNPVNQLGRYYNSSTNTPIEIKRFWTIGGSYTDTWTPAGVQNTTTTWVSSNLSRSLTISGATGATNSWWTVYPNASDVSKVGSGWPVDEVDYLTVYHWLLELKTSSIYVTAHCKGEAAPGSISTPTIAASDFPAGCLIRGDVEYNGSNHALLTTWARQISVASSSRLVTVQDFYNTSASSGFALANVTNGNKLKRLCLKQTADPGTNAATLMVSLDAIAENCVVINTLSTASKVIRPSDRGIIRNCISIGAKYALFSEWTSSKTEKSYGVGASIASCIWGNGRPAGNITNASEDATGDVGYQNLDPVSNFVDYANGDYRIRTTSPLHAAGIGAFFEESSEIVIEGYFTGSAGASLSNVISTKEINTLIYSSVLSSSQFLYEVIYGISGDFSSLAVASVLIGSSKAGQSSKQNSQAISSLLLSQTKESNSSVALSGSFTELKTVQKTVNTSKGLSSAVFTGFSALFNKQATTSKGASNAQAFISTTQSKQTSYTKPNSSGQLLSNYSFEIFFGISGTFLSSVLATLTLSSRKETLALKSSSQGAFTGTNTSTKSSNSIKAASQATWYSLVYHEKTGQSSTQSIVVGSTQLSPSKYAYNTTYSLATFSIVLSGSTKDILRQLVVVDSNEDYTIEFTTEEFSELVFSVNDITYSGG